MQAPKAWPVSCTQQYPAHWALAVHLAAHW